MARISYVSLGCPKALVDSERILTTLRSEGYDISREHAGADLVIVNTCGFLNSAQAESLEAIGSAMAENGKVVVTGCMGAEPEKITEQISQCVRRHRSAAIRERGRGGASRGAAGARSVRRSRAAGRHQAHAAPLRVLEDFRRLQQPLLVLHHPEAARRSRLAPRRRCVARGRAPGCSRREGAAGHLAGHVGVRRRHQVCGKPVERPRSAREVPRPCARARRARRLGAAALCLPLPARG